jgi:cytochrome c2
MKSPKMWAALAVAVGLAGCGASAPLVDLSAFSPEAQHGYQVLEQRCTRCHEIDRPLHANVGQGGWASYVRRMAKHPAAGISTAEQREIVKFLEAYAAQRAQGGTP